MIASSTRSGGTGRPRPRRTASRSTSRSSEKLLWATATARCYGTTRLRPPGGSRRSRRGRVRAAPGRRKSALRAESFPEPKRPSPAIALWRGPALADLASEPFAQAEIARLEGLRLEALEADSRRCSLSDASQRPSVSSRRSSRSTRSTSGFARTHGRSLPLGRHADALEAYRAFRQLLDEELGLEPNAELRQLEQAILRQDDSLGPVARSRRRHAPPTPHRARPPRLPPRRPRQVEDERRPVTVLFADIVGSTALGERLEPDEAKVSSASA